MKDKIIDKIGYLMFLVFIILISPYLFVTGGIVRIIRYYKYVSDTVHNKKIKKYDY